MINQPPKITEDEVVLNAYGILGNTRIQLHNLCNQANTSVPECCQKLMNFLPEIDKIGQAIYKMRTKKDGLL